MRKLFLSVTILSLCIISGCSKNVTTDNTKETHTDQFVALVTENETSEQPIEEEQQDVDESGSFKGMTDDEINEILNEQSLVDIDVSKYNTEERQIDTQYDLTSENETTLESVFSDNEELFLEHGITREDFNTINWEFIESQNVYSALYVTERSFISIRYNIDTKELEITE